MDIAQYRKRVEAELAKAIPPEPPSPLEAAEGGKRPSAAARVKAMAAATLDVENLDQQVPSMLAVVRDRGEPRTVRMAALHALAALAFLGPRFEPFRADYTQALRDVATDPEQEVRERALELLAIDKDPYAQELLVAGLKRPEQALVPEAKAVQLLGHDDHGEFVPLVRKVFRRSKGAAREEALRMLATDPKSERLFARLLKDKSEKRTIRRISASALQSLNPEAFERAARKIVADESDDNAVRATSLSALAHGREAREKPADPKLVEAVQKVGETTRSRSMRSSARRFLRSTEQ